MTHDCLRLDLPSYVKIFASVLDVPVRGPQLALSKCRYAIR